MKKNIQIGFDGTHENNQIIERYYISSFSKRGGYDKDLATDSEYQLLKKMVEYFLKENTDFIIFPESKFADLFCDESEDVWSITDELEGLNFYNFITYSYVTDEDRNLFFVIWLKNISEYIDDESALIPYYEALTERSYKCKGQYIYEVFEFIEDIPKAIWDIKIEQSGHNPEAECEFTTFMSLKEILLFFNRQPNARVLIDTVNYSEVYSGERRFYDWSKITDDNHLISILNRG